MLQRVGLAQALLADPDLVFLDEPTSALDPLGRREVRDIIHQLKQAGKTVFLNSHLLSEIELVCDRVVIIDRGRIVREGQLAALLNRKELEVRVSGVTPELLTTLSARYQMVEQHDGLLVLAIEGAESIPDIAECVVNAGARLYGLSERKGSLEDLFAEVVRGGVE
jgi:ABC-2 type transport system ATP-binding protein